MADEKITVFEKNWSRRSGNLGNNTSVLGWILT